MIGLNSSKSTFEVVRCRPGFIGGHYDIWRRLERVWLRDFKSVIAARNKRHTGGSEAASPRQTGSRRSHGGSQRIMFNRTEKSENRERIIINK
jgi:hypothetical protein